MTATAASAQPSTATLLIVDDDPMMIQLVAQYLEGMGRIRFAPSGMAALQVARQEPPDLILLDAEMPGMDGFDTCTALKQVPALQEVPVVFVTSRHALEMELRGFAVGAADFIHKPISRPILRARVATHLRLKRMSDELRLLASTDELTQLANKRVFDAAFALEWGRAKRARQSLGVLMIDVDHFKRFNDHYGHGAGDVCLHLVAQALRSALHRPSDLVARYGGEEFAVLLPDTTAPGAHAVGQRLLDAVLALRHPHEFGVPGGVVTVSIGGACSDGGELDTTNPDHTRSGQADREALMRRADLALYRAKDEGRARVCMHDGGVDDPAASKGRTPMRPDHMQ